MSILYPTILWLLIPIAALYIYRPKELSDTIHLLILILLTIALARPVWEKIPQKRDIEARDIIIALDVSYSMRAKDISPDRYSYAKDTIDEFLKLNIHDNITLIAFTTNPLLLSPPTTDHQLISTALKTLDIDNILTKGTSIKRLLQRVSTLPMSQKNMILITDGGDESDISTLFDIIRESSISLVVLALGSDIGATIYNRDGTLLRDERGDLVVSRINPMLKRLVDITSGVYLTASTSPYQTALSIEDSIDSMDISQDKRSKIEQGYIEFYPISLSIALLLFLMLHTKAVKYLILISTLWGIEASASIWDTLYLDRAYHYYHSGDYNSSQKSLKRIKSISLQSQVALASSYYQVGEYHKALRLYRSIRTTSLHIKAMLYYNIANTYTKLEQYEKATRYYSRSLQLEYSEDTLHNLGLVSLKRDRDLSLLSIAKPQSQSSSTKNSDQDEDESKSSDSKQSSGSSGGNKNNPKDRKKDNQNKKITLEPITSQKQPLSSKVYELINKGYIYEKQPW